MALDTATAAQRIALRNTAVTLGELTQPYAENAAAPALDEHAVRVSVAMTACAGAIATVQGTSGATVANGATVAVVNSASADSHNATATVTGTTLTNVKLAATVAFVDNADTVTVQNSAGAAVAGTHTATVATGALSNVKLAATIAPVASGLALTGVAPTGTYTNTVTFTVAAGVITAIVLS